jgi:membrane dipeptidase
MSRRQFVSAAAVGAVALGAIGAAPADATTQKRRNIVIDGLDASAPLMSVGFVRLLREAGVDCVHRSVRQFVDIGAIQGFADQYPNDVVIAKSVADIDRARTANRIALVLGAQDANYLERVFSKTSHENYPPLRATLRSYVDLGLRTQGICYNVTNIFGGGCLDHNVPLTRAGRNLVEEIHHLRVVLDVGGHTGEQTSLDAIAMSKGVPVVCTHTNMAALNPNPRAISDRLAEAAAKTGGVIGLTAQSDFIVRSARSLTQYPERSPQAQLDTFLDQYDYLKKLVGADHVALGPDFIWGQGPDIHEDTNDALVFPSDAMSEGATRLVKDFEDISKLPNLVRGLERRGWTQEELDKLLGLNWWRVYHEVWGA